MFKRKSEIIMNKAELSNYVNGSDVYNSKLVALLSDPALPRFTFKIGTHQYRPDLLAEEAYGSSSYMGLLILQSARGLETFTKGEEIELIKKESLDNLLANI